jgi:hypothetical protein
MRNLFGTGTFFFPWKLLLKGNQLFKNYLKVLWLPPFHLLEKTIEKKIELSTFGLNGGF